MKRRGGPATPLVDKHLLNRVQGFKNDIKTLLKTPFGNPLQTKYSVQKHKGEAGGAHGDVFFVGLKDKSSDQTFAIKRQVIKSPKHLTDRSYRELLIFQHLNQLALDNKCTNFVEIIDWFKATPNIMTPERQGSKQLMHFVLEYHYIYLNIYVYSNISILICIYNDTTNHLIVKDMLMEQLLMTTGTTSLPSSSSNVFYFKLCILHHPTHQHYPFSINPSFTKHIYALHVAQKELEFVHNDLHLRNILLKSLPQEKKYVAITDKDSSWIMQGYPALSFPSLSLSRSLPLSPHPYHVLLL